MGDEETEFLKLKLFIIIFPYSLPYIYIYIYGAFVFRCMYKKPNGAAYLIIAFSLCNRYAL